MSTEDDDEGTTEISDVQKTIVLTAIEYHIGTFKARLSKYRSQLEHSDMGREQEEGFDVRNPNTPKLS